MRVRCSWCRTEYENGKPPVPMDPPGAESHGACPACILALEMDASPEGRMVNPPGDAPFINLDYGLGRVGDPAAAIIGSRNPNTGDVRVSEWKHIKADWQPIPDPPTEPPLVQGGQGRTGEEVSATADALLAFGRAILYAAIGAGTVLALDHYGLI